MKKLIKKTKPTKKAIKVKPEVLEVPVIESKKIEKLELNFGNGDLNTIAAKINEIIECQ